MPNKTPATVVLAEDRLPRVLDTSEIAHQVPKDSFQTIL